MLLMCYHITQGESVFSILSLIRKCCRSTMLFLRDESQLPVSSLHMWHLMYHVRSRPLFWLFENVSGMRLGREIYKVIKSLRPFSRIVISQRRDPYRLKLLMFSNFKMGLFIVLGSICSCEKWYNLSRLDPPNSYNGQIRRKIAVLLPF